MSYTRLVIARAINNSFIVSQDSNGVVHLSDVTGAGEPGETRASMPADVWCELTRSSLSIHVGTARTDVYRHHSSEARVEHSGRTDGSWRWLSHTTESGQGGYATQQEALDALLERLA